MISSNPPIDEGSISPSAPVSSQVIGYPDIGVSSAMEPVVEQCSVPPIQTEYHVVHHNGPILHPRKDIPLWYEVGLCLCVVVMMCGIGVYLSLFYDFLGSFLSKDFIQDEYWVVQALLFRPTKWDYSTYGIVAMDSAPAAGLVYTGFGFGGALVIAGCVWYKVGGNARMVWLFTLFAVTGLNIIIYLIGRAVTDPDNFGTSDELQSNVNSVWIAYLIILFGLVIVLTLVMFGFSTGFHNSGNSNVKLYMPVGCAVSVWLYACAIFVLVYSVDGIAGIVMVFAGLALFMVVWICYTVRTVRNGTRTWTEEKAITGNNNRLSLFR